MDSKLDSANEPVRMASKRNSRVYSDELTHQGQKPSPTPYRSRRNSHASPKEDMMQAAKDAEEGEARRDAGVTKEIIAVSRSQISVAGTKESSGSRTSKSADTSTTSSSSASTSSVSTDLSPAPDGRPVNFGMVMPGVYRSSYPKPHDFGFLQGLNLKTLVTLVKKDEIDHDLETFVSSNGIRQVIINMKGTKKEEIPPNIMKAILTVALDRQNYPLLLHCNHGKHRTGCVVGVIRKVSGWDVDAVLDEYRSYAAPKVRECDIEYISGFQSSALHIETVSEGFGPRQLRTFFRTLLFSTFVLVLWLVSGTHMAPKPPDRLSH